MACLAPLTAEHQDTADGGRILALCLSYRLPLILSVRTYGLDTEPTTGDGSNVLSCCYGGCSGASAMNFTLECEQEVDGRWIAEVPELPGVLSYGSSAADAMSRAEILALRVIADRLEHGEAEPVSISLSLPVVA